MAEKTPEQIAAEKAAAAALVKLKIDYINLKVSDEIKSEVAKEINKDSRLKRLSKGYYFVIPVVNPDIVFDKNTEKVEGLQKAFIVGEKQKAYMKETISRTRIEVSLA